MRSSILSNRILPDVENFPPPSANPVIPLDILPIYLEFHGYESVGMDNFCRLIVQPKSALQLEEAARIAQAGG